MSSNHDHGEVYSLQQYVIKAVSDLRQVWFSPGILVSSTNKTDRRDITEILLKVALSTITLTLLLSIEIMLLVIHCMYFSVRNQWNILRIDLSRNGLWGLWVYGVKHHFQQYFSYSMAVRFIGGGNRRTWRKHAASHWQSLSHNVVLSTPRHERDSISQL